MIKLQKYRNFKQWKPISWLVASRKHIILASILAATLLAASTVALIRVGGEKSTDSNSQTAKIHIESNIPSVNIQGSPYCDSRELQKQTPYDCELSSDQHETVLTAPAEAVANGETYVFETWDGCSESNEDKKICKIRISQGETKTAKVSYEKPSASDTRLGSSGPATGGPSNGSAAPSSAPGCPGAPDSQKNPPPYEGAQIYCVVDINVPAGSTIFYKNDVRSGHTPGKRKSVNLYATCYHQSGIDVDACTRQSGDSKASAGSPIVFQLSPDRSVPRPDGVQVLKTTTVVISTSYQVEEISCGVSCVSTGRYHNFEKWEINKLSNGDGTNTYEITTYRALSQ
jgi:hypothetical protein